MLQDLLDAHLDSVEAKGETCDVNHFDTAFTSAFLKTDEEFGKVLSPHRKTACVCLH